MEEDSSSSSDRTSSLDHIQEVGSEFEKFQKEENESDLLNLSEAKAMRLKLMNSLIKILQLQENGKMCIIASLVYMDKISMGDDIICSQKLHS